MTTFPFLCVHSQWKLPWLPPHVLHTRPLLRGILLHLHPAAKQNLEGDEGHEWRLQQGTLHVCVFGRSGGGVGLYSHRKIDSRVNEVSLASMRSKFVWFWSVLLVEVETHCKYRWDSSRMKRSPNLKLAVAFSQSRFVFCRVSSWFEFWDTSHVCD